MRLAVGGLVVALVLAGTASAKTSASFAVATTDDGSCGHAWARDSLSRTYRVQRMHGGYRVERRDRGTFVTLAARSPGACAPKGRHGTTVSAGLRGAFRGDLSGVVTGGVYDPNAFCTGDCGSTDVWVRTHFGAGARFSCLANDARCRFDFDYRATAKGLRFRRWTDRGEGSGTLIHERYSGDIADGADPAARGKTR